jgi:TPR repeat protein
LGQRPEDKLSEPLPDLSNLPVNPRLNPLLNPTLGRNLGRWAQVYLSTPPEQREQAIANLLQQLEAESSAGPSNGLGQSGIQPVLPTVCPKCGHRSLDDAKFCGLCGASLFDAEQFLVDTSAQRVGPIADSVSSTTEQMFTPAPSVAAAAGPSASPAFTPSTAPAFNTAPAAAHDLPSFATAPASAPAHEAATNMDLNWLREKSFSGYLYDEPRSYGRFVAGLLVILLVGGLFYYLRQSNALKSGVSQLPPAVAQTSPQSDSIPANSAATPQNSEPQPSSPAPAAAAPATTVPTPTPPANVPDTHPAAEDAAPPAATSSADHKRATAPPNAREVLPAKPTAPDASAAASNAAAVDDGSAELAMAEDYLEGRRGPRNSVVAAKLLWKAVGKQNDTAILLLSGLYAAGDGVPQSCDQARLLLDAAAKRNVHAAAERLRTLQNTCQ